MSNLPPKETVEAFVLRARRICAHSLMKGENRELLQNRYEGTITIQVTKDSRAGTSSHVMVARYPAEETMESLAARMRPLMLQSEPIAFHRVVSALRLLIGERPLPDECDSMDSLLAQWEELVLRDESSGAQAYAIQTDTGSVSDRALMYAWLYGDLVHANAWEDTKGATYEQRYFGAVDVLARIADFVDGTLFLIKYLVAEHFFALDSDVFVEEVTVRDTNKRFEVTGAYARDPSMGMPEDMSSLDPTEWDNGFDLIEQVFQADRCAHWRDRGRGIRPLPSAADFIQKREN